MKTGSPHRYRAMGVLACALAALPLGRVAVAQQDAGATAQLLGKAHALEVRGRLDMARQTWQQVLLVDPNNAEALAGMARAAKLEGRQDEANAYLGKLRSVNPNDPNIARIENLSTQQDTTSQLQEAGRLAQNGQYGRAMQIYRQVYGNTPPPGDAALAFYQTEAASEETRPAAIAGLRALVDKYPSDARYQIALGKILTYNPRTRAEGRKLLEKHPNDPDANEALRQSLVWDSQNPATAGDIRAYLAKHKDQQLETALSADQAQAAANAEAARAARAKQRPLTAAERAAQAAYAARTAEDQAGFRELNAKHLDAAESHFKVSLERNPQDGEALAGLGYVRMAQSNFGGAISYLEQARQDSRALDPGVDKALADSRYFFTMQTATAALDGNDLTQAATQFQAALRLRPNDPGALLGLGGTYLKAQQADAALPIFVTYVHVQPTELAAWRGLFMAQFGTGHYNDALAIDRRVPANVHRDLMKDPDYLRTMASVYMALGRDADAQRVLRAALDLPFPAGGQGVKVDAQLQFAALLSTAGHKDQALGLYSQVLAADPSNANAWVGRVTTAHEIGRDPEAFQVLQSMPPDVYTRAMSEPGFETTVAAIDEGQGRDDLAQAVLEKFLSDQQNEGKKLFVPAQVQLAAIYMRHDDSARAFPLYRSILAQNPDRADAWRGLLTALHATGHDNEALAEIQQIPPSVRRDLENDPAYLQTVGSMYASLGQPQEAMLFLARTRQHYASQHVTVPADIEIQSAWLLYNSNADAELYRELMLIGGRTDLTDPQRLTVQQIWTSFAVRRATQANAAGQPRTALAILNAAAQTFPGNPEVLKALASGYAAAGEPKEAVAIFRSMDLTKASATDYHAAVGAALAANDLKSAEMWLRFGLAGYPRDPVMLNLAGKFEQARGDNGRASEFYRTSLALMPKNDTASGLTGALALPPPRTPGKLPVASQDLATMMAQPFSASGSVPATAQAPAHPYLPGSVTSSNAPIALPGSGSGVPASGTGYDPGMQPAGVTPADTLGTSSSNGATPRRTPSTLKDYAPPAPQQPYMLSPVQPQSSAAPLPLGAEPIQLKAHGEAYRPFFPGDDRPLGAGEQASLLGGAAPEGSQAADVRSASWIPQQGAQPQNGTTALEQAIQQSSGSGQVPPPAPKPAAHPQTRRRVNGALRQKAAAIHANQTDAPQLITGQSHPPQENIQVQPMQPVPTYGPYQPYGSAPTNLNPAQYAPYTLNGAASQTTQPQAGQTGAPGTTGVQSANPQFTPGTPAQGVAIGQQYPQPTDHSPGLGVTPRRRTRRSAAVQTAPPPPPPPPQPPMSYPTVAQPLTNPGLPQTGQPYPMGQAPSDYDLQRMNLPPLRSYVDTRVDPRAPLSARQQTELDLASIEGSYSAWLGGSVLGRYRSGTPGLDRLSTLEVPFEASVAIGQTARLSVVPMAIFLNSGQLDTTSGTSGTGYILGTERGNAAVAPQPQFASGLGGEIQLTTNSFAGAIGYTPYSFLVSNVIGRGQWRPANGHFLVFGGRDAVKETELSYAGLRDPQSATLNNPGNVWGGVTQTSGGIRFDAGDEKSGLYIMAEGGELSGYHVLDNVKVDGTMGAYFRMKSWPEYGHLDIGGVVFGEHFSHNERPETYGLGGYFSPGAYFLAALPISFTGHYGSNLHYTVSGSLGLQSFQEDSQNLFPLDRAQQSAANTACAADSLQQLGCSVQPVNSNTGVNFSIDSQISYRVNEHWYVGGFLSANNTNNYDMVQGGFYARYLFRPQVQTVEYPTGLFPAEGFRPLRVP